MSEANGWFEANNSLSLLVLADPIHRRDRAAPLPRPLPPGMGSRTGIPRRTAGPMGSARLAKQTRTAVAESRSILGCALAAATKIGGRCVSRPALRFANAAEESRVHRSRGADAQLGNRREHGALYSFRCGRIAASAGEGPGPHREDLSERIGAFRARGEWVLEYVLFSRIYRLPGQYSGLLRFNRLCRRVTDAGRR